MIVELAIAAALAADSAGPRRPVALQDSTRRAADQWIAGDKFMHFHMSYAVTAFAFGATCNAHVSVAAGAAAGILKEVYDKRAGKPFSGRDLVWDAAGIALGYAIMKQVR
jgi:uncharacterized protein YfiM (DUF2279 family)